MAEDFDAKLTELAADILRDAVRVYDPSASFNSWNAAAVRSLDVTGSFAAVTGPFPAVTGSFPATTGSFAALTGSFRAIMHEPDEPQVTTLKHVFNLPPRLPGVLLPPERELAMMARSAPIMTGLDALARWLGKDGRLVTDTDELTEADAADAARRLGIKRGPLSFLWEYALTSGWVELLDSEDGMRSWAVIGQTAWHWADGDDRGAVHVWAAVFAAVAATALPMGTRADRRAARKLNFEGQGAALPVMLFLTRQSGMTTRDVTDLVRDGAIGQRPSSRLKRAWDTWVRQHGDPAHHLLGELSATRAVTVRAVDGPVELTPLALWTLRSQFALDRVSVPLLIPPSPRMSAAALVALSDAVGAAELDAAFALWMRDRDPDQAVRELLIFAGSADASGRLAAVDIARRIGLPAYRAWRDAMDRPELRGYARITLSMMAADLPESTLPLILQPNPDDMAWLATDLLAMACGTDQPDPDEIAAQFTEAVPPGEEEWIFGLMAQSSHPDVARVLDVLSACHPDHRVARSARKAARAMVKNRPGGGRREPARAAGL